MRSLRALMGWAVAIVLVLPAAGSADVHVYGHVEFQADGGVVARARGKFVDRFGEAHKREGIKLGSKKDGGTAEVEASPSFYEGGSVRLSFSVAHLDSKLTGQPYFTAGFGWEDKFDAVLVQRTGFGIQFSATNEGGVVPGSTETLDGEPGDLYRLDIENAPDSGGTRPHFRIYNERLKIGGPIFEFDAADTVPQDQPLRFRAAAVDVPKKDCVEIYRRRYDLGTAPDVQTQEAATRFRLGLAFAAMERMQKDAEDEKDDLVPRALGYVDSGDTALEDADILLRAQFAIPFKRKSPEEKLVKALGKTRAKLSKLGTQLGGPRPPEPKALFRKARSLSKRSGRLLDDYLGLTEE